MRNSRGIMEYENGDRYEGNWRNDVRHGKGKMTWQSNANRTPELGGWRYEGEWQEDLPEGHGVLLYDVDGGKYEGSWVQGKKFGLGREMLPDGVVYEGEFKSNVRDGKGRLTDANGDVYEGKFVEGKRWDGKAIVQFANGDKVCSGCLGPVPPAPPCNSPP